MVWGMPKEAVHLGAAEATLPIDRIAGAILHRARRLDATGATISH